MVNFAELKAKAEKAKDVSVTKVTNTKDRFISAPSSKMNWDPNWKRPPPPPPSAPRGSTSSASSPPPAPALRSRPDFAPSTAAASQAAPPPVPRGSRPMGDLSMPAPPPYTPQPPPTRVVSGYPPAHRDTSQDSAEKIDWANLSPEDKEEFFSWLDEFFSRYLGIELGPRQVRPRSAPPSARGGPGVNQIQQRTQGARPPPMVNMATRPQV